MKTTVDIDNLNEVKIMAIELGDGTLRKLINNAIDYYIKNKTEKNKK